MTPWHLAPRRPLSIVVFAVHSLVGICNVYHYSCISVTIISRLLFKHRRFTSMIVLRVVRWFFRQPAIVVQVASSSSSSSSSCCRRVLSCVLTERCSSWVTRACWMLMCVCGCHLLCFAMSCRSDGRWASVAGCYEYCIVIPVVLAVRHWIRTQIDPVPTKRASPT